MTASGAPIRNAFTVDVEDYFMVSAAESIVPKSAWAMYPSRVVQNTQRVLDLMAKASARGTFFVVGWVAERFPRLIRQIDEAGHEVGCHGYHHRLVYDLTPEAFRLDLRRAKHGIESALGKAVIGYRAPSFSIVPQSGWALKILAEEGFRYDSSVLPAAHARGGWTGDDVSRFPFLHRDMIEFPISTWRFVGRNWPFSGGGYFRLLPYRWVKAGINQLNLKEKKPAMIYLHPWELDPEQPRLPLRGMNRFRHYVNLRRTKDKASRILSEFLWAPVRDILTSENFPTFSSSNDGETSKCRPEHGALLVQGVTK